MSTIIFKNDLGEVNFSGAGSFKISITDISGLETPERVYETRSYLDFDGQTTVSSRFLPRTIAISFDIKGPNPASELAEIYKILSRSGTLYFCFRNASRKIQVNQIFVAPFSKAGSFCRKQTVQFICDNPFFSDFHSVTLPCYETTKNLFFHSESNSWNLDVPTVWGANNNDKVFENSGHIKAYPTFTIYSKGDALDSNGFEILKVHPNNPETVLQRFALNYALSDGEAITVCFNSRSEKERRYISSSLGTNLLNHRSENSSLADFYFEIGKNRLILNNLSEGNTLSASFSYDNQYVEEVF